MGAPWLACLGFPAATLWSQGLTARLVGLPLLAVFSVVYLVMLTEFSPFMTPHDNRRQILRWLMLWGVMASLVLLLGANALFLSVYLVAVSVSSITQPLNFWLGAVTLLLALMGSTLLGEVPWRSGVLYAVVLYIVMSVWVISATRSARERKLRDEALVAQERNRIATDVHDLLGHSLTVVKLKAQLIDKLLSRDPERAHAELHDVLTMVDEALVHVRRTVDIERSRALREELASATAALKAAGVDLEVRGDVSSPCGPMALVLGWIVREATTNVLRHAHASLVRITVTATSLAVDDDGDGFNGTEGNGIRGMRERIAQAGGSLVVGESPLGGTMIEVTW